MMTHTEFSWKSSKGTNIYAQEWRPESDLRGGIALVHGLGEHSGRYAHVADALGKAGYGMVAFDLPGHGKTEGVRGHASFKEIFIEIDRLIDETRKRYPGKPVFLYGHSMGGCVGIAYLLDRMPKLSGAVITSPGLGVLQPVPAAKLLLARIMSRLNPSMIMTSGLETAAISRDPEVVKNYVEDPLVHGMISAKLGFELLTIGEGLIARAGELVVPTLLLQGAADRIVDPKATERFAQAAGGKVSYKVYQGCYHELHNEPQKEEVFTLIVEWLKGKS